MPARNRPGSIEIWIMSSAFLASCYCGFMFFWSVIDAFDSTATMYGIGVMISSYIGVKVAGPKRPSVD
jgi:hypothetical protein